MSSFTAAVLTAIQLPVRLSFRLFYFQKSAYKAAFFSIMVRLYDGRQLELPVALG